MVTMWYVVKIVAFLFSELANLTWSIILYEEGLPQKMFAGMFIILGKDFRQCKDY